MSELELAANVQRGDHGFDVKRVQEWLTLQGFGLSIDQDFGPATEAAVEQFQTWNGLDADGVVTPELFALLVAPMRAALQPIAPDGRTLGALTIAYAQQHLAEHPLEVGGDNRGPWVRLYMAGEDGPDQKWCAGFACFCLEQAASSLGVTPPIEASSACTDLGRSAKAHGLFVSGADAAIATRLTPGSFLLRRTSPTEWHHTGLVTAAAAETFTSIEGNTNDAGSSNGYEVCLRTHGYAPYDFILIA
ncbi:MAG TPA: peptidoglycan-binding domain-containing protein [Polyangia bacterium]|nr:peptidoglycan-binding domain-containing protein [Polyangia bacterium]